jgi:hypothetical protein
MDEQTGAGGAEGGAPPEKTIPYSRFQEVVRQKQELAAKLDATGAEVQALSEKVATVGALTETIAKLKAEQQRTVAGYEERLALVSFGINDAEGQTVARALYNGLPDAERPKSIADYLGQFKGDSEDAPAPPRALAPYLQPAQAAPQEKSTPFPGGPKGQPTPPRAPGVTADALRAAREKGQRSGDWSDYKALRNSMGANIG